MKSETEKKTFTLPAVLAACLLLFMLVGGVCFTEYLRQQIFAERTTQLSEITSQVRVNLSNTLDSHWNYLTAAVNLLEEQSFTSVAAAAKYIGRLEQLLETGRYGSMSILLDDRGNYCDVNGVHGVWANIGVIASGGDRYTLITSSYDRQSSYWTFVRKLEVHLVLSDKSTVFIYAVLLSEVNIFAEHYGSAAYCSQN